MFRSLQHEHVYTMEPFPCMSQVLYISALSYDLHTLHRNSGDRDAFDSNTARQLFFADDSKIGKELKTSVSRYSHRKKREKLHFCLLLK